MPLRYYSAIKPGRCPQCKTGFDLFQPATEELLTTCPRCGSPIVPKQALVHSPKILKPISTREAKEAGFTVLEKNKHGLYEKQ